jgi:hypothetical protein
MPMKEFRRIQGGPLYKTPTPKTTREIPHSLSLQQKNFHPNLQDIVVFDELRAVIFAYLYLPETISP